MNEDNILIFKQDGKWYKVIYKEIINTCPPSYEFEVEGDYKEVADPSRAIEIALLKDLVEEAEGMTGAKGNVNYEEDNEATGWESAIFTLITNYQDRIKKLEQ